ncbi:methyl-CpG-binding domain protein 6 [Mauremys reevesii]|uniref:methyl-CpG-binding domain protein 6 n=1 Tax=Mauremys reevesii TaxID=260615 RepID=UPI00193FBCF7|nr:methyl-CpG-binding domain protein 6 [Mauremys reevesii]
MNGGDEPAGGDPGGCPVAVPVGWQRKVEEGAVRYISPSGTNLTSLEQTRAYLLTDGTCKCGLECPLNVHKVFNFNPVAVVVPRGGAGAGARGDQDMTKLCNHRRKTVAMATLYRSMESAAPLGLPHLGPGAGLSQTYHSGIASRQQPAPFGRAPGPEGEGPGKPQPMERAPADPCLACPGDRPTSTRPSQASSFPRHHGALFGDVFPGRTPCVSSSNGAYPGRPACPLQSFGLEPLDAAPRPFPLSSPFPSPDEMVPPAAPSPLGKPPVPATPPPEGAPAWSSRACPLPAGASLGRLAASATLSSVSSPGGSAELSPQCSRPSSTSSEPGGPPLGPRPCKDEAAPSNALANQSSNNPPVPLGAVPEGKGPPGFLGLPLSQLLQQPGAASFPASSLLSAAAKAQLASQRRADAEPPSSTLPGRLLGSNVLLSGVGGRALPKPRRQRRAPTVLRLLKDSQQGPAGPEEAPAHRARPREQPPPGGAPPPGEAKGSPLTPRPQPAAVVPAEPAGRPAPRPAPAAPGRQPPRPPALLPGLQQPAPQPLQPAGLRLLRPGLREPPPAESARPQQRRATVSAATTKAASGSGPCSGAGEGSLGGQRGLPPPAPEPFPFLGQEQVLPFGGALPPGLLQGGFLGSLPFSLALSQPQLLGCPGQGEAPLPALGLPGEPEGQVLQTLLMASLLQSQPQSPLLPLGGLGLPGLDLLQQPGSLLPALLPLPDPPCQGDLPDGPLQPLLFPALPASPAVLALNSALLAAGLAAPDAQPGVAGSPMAPTSTGTTPTTTEAPEPPGAFGSAPVPPSSSGRLHPLLPPLVSPLLSAALLGDLSALGPLGATGGPLLQSQPQLLPPALPAPLGFQLFQGQPPVLSPLGSSSPLACLLQLSPGFGAPEKPAPSEGPSPNPPSVPEPEPPAPFAPFCTDAAPPALPSALDSPAVPRATDCPATGPLEPAGPGQQGALGFATPVGQLERGSRTPLKRARPSGEGLNGNIPPRAAPRRTKSARRGARRGRGAWGSRRHFNGQAGEPGEKAAPSGHSPHPAWRCNGEIPVPGPASPLAPSKAEERKGNPGRLRPSRRGRRRKVSAPRPSTRLETPRARGPTAEPGSVPTEDGASGRRPRPGRPAKNRRRKLVT